MLNDHAFLEWTRGNICEQIGEMDVIGAGDVRLCQLVLYTLARVMHARSILEIGVADGSTSIPLLKAAAETGGHVTSVDPSFCRETEFLVQRCGYENIWTYKTMKSEEHFRENNDPLDFAYVDGDHDPEAVFNDFNSIYDRLIPGGYLVTHDWAPYTKLEDLDVCFHAGYLLGLISTDSSDDENRERVINAINEMEDTDSKRQLLYIRDFQLPEMGAALNGTRIGYGAARAGIRLLDAGKPFHCFQFNPYHSLRIHREHIPDKLRSEGGFAVFMKPHAHIETGDGSLVHNFDVFMSSVARCWTKNIKTN